MNEHGLLFTSNIEWTGATTEDGLKPAGLGRARWDVGDGPEEFWGRMTAGGGEGIS